MGRAGMDRSWGQNALILQQPLSLGQHIPRERHSRLLTLLGRAGDVGLGLLVQTSHGRPHAGDARQGHPERGPSVHHG